MKPSKQNEVPGAWGEIAGPALIKQLWALRASMLAREREIEPWLAHIAPARRASAANLAHFLAMRKVDLRGLQERLARIGVSSLGRAETHVLANLDKVLGLLHRLDALPWTPLSEDEPAGFGRGTVLLAEHAQALFGPPPPGRSTRIMVTLPSTAAHDDELVRGLVDAGMDIARINCAHDGPAEWLAMSERVRRAAQQAGRPLRVLMDLAGPKLRTGPIAGAAGVVKLKPRRDAYGRRTGPARLGLRPAGSALEVAGAEVTLAVPADWLAARLPGQRIALTDARGSRRQLTVTERQGDGVLLECTRTTYLTTETPLSSKTPDGDVQQALLTDLPVEAAEIQLARGDLLHLVVDGLGHGAVTASRGHRAAPATIACTLPEALPRVRKGQRIWFDDGRIGGHVLRGGAKRVVVQISEARAGGEHLAADKGINLPDTRLDLPALTAKDLEDLAVAARAADIVGLSFAQSAADVRTLQARLKALKAGHLGLMLKIETRRGFERLPEMLLAAMASPAAGVMIARGDLAVECGYERMAEVQEQILWAAEAAHMPVVWATQVLETLAKTGLPSRAEITDAAMGGRAECVMLNKGPHITDAIHTLDDILQRMQAHQSKKRPLLRALKAWNLPLQDAAPPRRKRKAVAA